MSAMLTLPVPSMAGSLEQYIQAVNRVPMLTPEQENDLATRLQRDNDLDAAKTLVMSHLRVVVSVARGFSGYGLQQADLIQEGNIGLMKAVKRFEPTRGVRLFSFAIHWIKAEIHEFILRNWRLVRAATTKHKETQTAGVKPIAVAVGNKGLGFLNRVGVPVVSQVTQIGDVPHLDKLIGPVKSLLDAYERGEVRAVYLCYTKFINAMKQEPVVQQLLPLSSEGMEQGEAGPAWDYIYEPDAPSVIDELLVRNVEWLAYQAVAENMAPEQSARMVAMKAATDNAGSVIGELKLIYNKTRQAAITKELSEIVAGAAAV